MNRTNVICLLLAVAGLSFGIGQTVGEDRAEAGAQSARVQLVKDKGAQKWLRYMSHFQDQSYGELLDVNRELDRHTAQLLPVNDNLKDIERQLFYVCLNVRPPGGPLCPTP